jgi:hypothetical protein
LIHRNEGSPGGGCLSSHLRLSSHLSRSVGCCVFRHLSLSLLSPRPGALASFIHYALTFRCTPLVRLVFALIGASPPPSRRDSARCHLSSHPPHLVGLSHCPAPWPIVRMVVMLPLVTPLPPVCLRLSLTRRHSCSLTINFYSCVLFSVSTITWIM